jgi:hypothetical protein
MVACAQFKVGDTIHISSMDVALLREPQVE